MIVYFLKAKKCFYMKASFYTYINYTTNTKRDFIAQKTNSLTTLLNTVDRKWQHYNYKSCSSFWKFSFEVWTRLKPECWCFLFFKTYLIYSLIVAKWYLSMPKVHPPNDKASIIGVMLQFIPKSMKLQKFITQRKMVSWT